MYNSINYSANMSAKNILRWCCPAKMLIMSSKFSSIPYLMCMSASPVILSCPMVERRHVLRWQKTLILCSHSLLVTGNVQIKRRSIWMFGNMDSLAWSSDFEGVSGSLLFSNNFHLHFHICNSCCRSEGLGRSSWQCSMSSSSSDDSASWSVMKTDGTMLRAIIFTLYIRESVVQMRNHVIKKKGIVFVLLKYSSGVFEGTFSLFVWWVHLCGREGGNALILPPSDTTESYNFLW